MDLLSIALILIALWVAIIIVCLALARAAGKADRETDPPAARGEPTRESLAERSPLDALADQVMRSNTGAGAEGVPEQPVRDRRALAKRLRKRSRLTANADRIRNSLH